MKIKICDGCKELIRFDPFDVKVVLYKDSDVDDSWDYDSQKVMQFCGSGCYKEFEKCFHEFFKKYAVDVNCIEDALKGKKCQSKQ